MKSVITKSNAKEIYPCDYGKQHRNSSAHVALIARIDFLSINFITIFKNGGHKMIIVKVVLF